MTKEALMPVGDSPDAFAAFYAGEIAKWSKILKPSGPPPD
jgi:hypothetical protein